MADFEAVLRKTLDGMTDPAPDARAKVYERARATITRQIDAMEKRPSEAAIQRQFEKLEAAIEVIEAEYAAPEPPATDEDDDSDLDHLFEEPVAPPPPVEAAPPPPEPEEPAVQVESVEPAMDEPAMDESPPAPPAVEPPPPVPPRAPEMAAPPPPPPRPEPRLEPETDPDDPLAAFLRDQEKVANGDFSVLREDRGEAAADSAKGDRERARRVPLPAGGRQALPWIGAAVAVLVLAGAAVYFGSGLFGSSTGTETMESGVPVREAPSTTVTLNDTDTGAETPDSADAPADGAVTPDPDAPQKFTQRLTPDGGEVDEGPAGAPGTTGEGTSISGQSGGDTVQPPATAGTQTDTGAQPAIGDATPSALPVGQNAIFYQERTGAQPGTAEKGAAIWSVVQESPGGDLPPEPAIRAEVSVPELDLTMEMTIRRNADDTFPASHVIELLFRVPDSFEGRGIADVQRITFKGTEQDPGNALIGVAAPLDTNIFLIALTDAQTAIDTNLSLMRREQWIDIPMQYVSGRRALITLEKGIPGEQAFNEVLAAWDKAGPPKAAQN